MTLLPLKWGHMENLCLRVLGCHRIEYTIQCGGILDELIRVLL
jgi:hypothetical protein